MATATARQLHPSPLHSQLDGPRPDSLAPAPFGITPGEPEARCDDLLEDILDYRALRARSLSAPLGQSERGRLDALEDSLREREHGRDQPSLRAYHRFTYTRPAKLRVAGASAGSLDVTIDNLSAGGVKLLGAGELSPGDRVWLQVERADGTSVVLPARVAWGANGACGLMFAGAPAPR